MQLIHMFDLPMPIIAIILIVVISIFNIWLFGWFDLSKRYPLKDGRRKSIKTFKMQSVRFGYAKSTFNFITIIFDDEGITLYPFILYSFFQKPIYFRWKDIIKYKTSNIIFGRSIFYIEGYRLSFYGRSARFLQEQMEKQPPYF